MKKDILFVINNLNCGGAEKALISLLEDFDYEKYNVDLFLFKHEGIFMKYIPDNVNLLPEVKDYRYFDMAGTKAVINLIRQLKINILVNRIKFKFLRGYKNSSEYEQMGWKYVSSAFPKLSKKYDTAIGYLEKNPIYYVVEKVDAKKKIGWIHNDYNKLGLNKNIDDYYFSMLNYIVTVSDECLNILKQVFPQYKDKLKMMHNIVNYKNIKKLATEEVKDFEFDNKNINIVSIGRLTYQKGFEIAIEACKLLIKKKYPIKWIIIGEGEERTKLENLVKEYNLEDSIFLLGLKENPYSYMNKADIYVQPSRFEGKSIAIDEAKVLDKPIVVTDFTTVKDQIQNNINGIITEVTPEGIAEGIERILNNISLNEKNKNKNKIHEYCDYSTEMSKLYEIMEGKDEIS